MADSMGATSSRGNFVQGTTAVLLLKVTSFEGDPLSAESITVTIKDSLDVTVETSNPTFASEGFYVYDWEIPADQTLGEYTVIWVYSVEGTSKTETQRVVVSDNLPQSTLYNTRISDFRIALERYICCAQAIPTYYEEAKPSSDSQMFRFTFPNWNQSPGVRIFRNGQLLNSGFDVDFFKGNVRFDTALTAFDRINADYNFRFFTDEDLDRYLINAVQTINAWPPHGSRSINNIDDRYITTVIYLAASDALRKLIMCLQFQEPQEIFGGPEKAKDASNTFETLKQNYEKMAMETLENKKYGPYVGLTKAVVAPTFTLPGGRSRWFRYLFSGAGAAA